MNTRLVNSAAGVVNAALARNVTAAGVAMALDSAGLLMSPETAAELARLRSYAAAQRVREEELLAAMGRVDLRETPEVWALGMTVLAHLDGPLSSAPEGLEPGLRGLIKQLRARVAELEAAPTTVYRAEHPDSGITLGHYGTDAAARAHCKATERRSWGPGHTLVFDWIEDDEDRVAELVVTAGQNEESTTGYIVTALELDSEYDEAADE